MVKKGRVHPEYCLAIGPTKILELLNHRVSFLLVNLIVTITINILPPEIDPTFQFSGQFLLGDFSILVLIKEGDKGLA